MLISLSVKNFRSIGREACISPVPDKSRSFPDHILEGDILKTCAIFGQNGSGKSTIVQALNYLKCAITSDNTDDGLCLLNTNPEKENVIIDIVFACRFNHIHQSMMNVIDPSHQLNPDCLTSGDSIYRYRVEIDPRRPIIVHEIIDTMDNTDDEPLFNSSKRGISTIRGDDEYALMNEHNNLNRDIMIAESNLNTIIQRKEELKQILSGNTVIEGELDIVNGIIIENEKKRLNQIQIEMKSLQEAYDRTMDNLMELRRKRNRIVHEKKSESEGFLIPLKGKHPRFKNEEEAKRYLLEDVIRPSIRTWILNTLEIIDTKGYVLESLDSDELDRLSEIISEFDVGIEAIKWQPIHQPDESFNVKSIIYETDVNTRQNIEDMLKDDYICDRSLSFRTARGIFKITKHKGIFSIYQLMTRHRDGNMFSINSESDGTRRVIELASILLPSDDDHVYIVDELDYRLHPVLISKFLKKFYACDSKGRKQLIFTTHETNILSRDLFRLDEIWMADQDGEGSSYYTCLSEKSGKINKKLSDLYLKEGKLGGIPLIKDS